MLRLFLLSVAFVRLAAGIDPADLVDTKIGTDGIVDLSRGSSQPLIGRPWGHTYWSVQTFKPDAVWPSEDNWYYQWFHPDHRMFWGLRCTHQPSPWIHEYGAFILQPDIPDIVEAQNQSKDYVLGYVPERATFKPHLFESDIFGGSATGDKQNAHIKMTGTGHAAIAVMQVQPGETRPGKDRRGWTFLGDGVTIKPIVTVTATKGNEPPFAATVEKDNAGNVVKFKGHNRYNNGGQPGGAYFIMYFVLEFDPPVPYYEEKTVLNEWRIMGEQMFGQVIPKTRVEHHFKYGGDVENMTVKMGVSFISASQAQKNLDTEVKKQTFEEVMEDGRKTWNHHLDVAKVTDSGFEDVQLEEDKLKIFYSALYRASLFPRSLVEEDGANRIHWNPYVDKPREEAVGKGELSTDSGFWDAFNTVWPLLGLLFPDRLNEAVDGYLTVFDTAGWIPQWSATGFVSSMVGTMSDSSFADAIVKGIATFDKKKALDSAFKNALGFPSGPLSGRIGRSFNKDYLKHDFIPADAPDDNGKKIVEESSRTLNNYIADWGIAQAARVLYEETKNQTLLDLAKTLEARSKKFDIIFDKDMKMFRPKLTNGNWMPDFDEFAWAGSDIPPGHFTEGTAWQYRFFAQHDLPKLADLYGGKREYCDTVKMVLQHRPIIHTGPHTHMSHEQNELILNGFGMYSHNNQPMHPVLYTPIALAGDDPALQESCVYMAQYWIRQVMERLYTLDGYAGDEDNGEMGAWFVLSALGLYDMLPGSTYYVLGSPFFKEVVVSVGNGKELKVSAPNNCPKCYKVTSATFNGKPVKDWKIDHQELMKGGTLEFIMPELPDDDESSAVTAAVSSAVALFSLCLGFF